MKKTNKGKKRAAKKTKPVEVPREKRTYTPLREMGANGVKPTRKPTRGLPERESLRMPASVSWNLETLKVAHAHAAKLRIDRSKYVRACVEHCSGLLHHPELVNGLSKFEIERALREPLELRG